MEHNHLPDRGSAAWGAACVRSNVLRLGQLLEQCTIILVDGGILQITDNLGLALGHLRHKRRARVLWENAICINQLDNLEESHQVSCMGAIYQQEVRVLFWLSESDAESHV
jgi:hypothetical protein